MRHLSSSLLLRQPFPWSLLFPYHYYSFIPLLLCFLGFQQLPPAVIGVWVGGGFLKCGGFSPSKARRNLGDPWAMEAACFSTASWQVAWVAISGPDFREEGVRFLFRARMPRKASPTRVFARSVAGFPKALVSFSGRRAVVFYGLIISPGFLHDW